jgi:hypothetical protein
MAKVRDLSKMFTDEADDYLAAHRSPEASGMRPNIPYISRQRDCLILVCPKSPSGSNTSVTITSIDVFKKKMEEYAVTLVVFVETVFVPVPKTETNRNPPNKKIYLYKSHWTFRQMLDEIGNNSPNPGKDGLQDYYWFTPEHKLFLAKEQVTI